jgi:hypothetical protein
MNTATPLKQRIRPDSAKHVKPSGLGFVGLKSLAHSDPEKALRDHSGDLTDAQFDFCCRRSPYHALLHAPERLAGTDLLRLCCQREPWSALVLAAAQLTPKLLDLCCSHETELLIQSSVIQLSDEQYECCCRKDPLAALLYGSQRLTPGLFDHCFKMHPIEAMRHAPAMLCRRHIRYLSEKHLDAVLNQIRDDPDPRLLMILWQHRKCIHAAIGSVVSAELTACI